MDRSRPGTLSRFGSSVQLNRQYFIETTRWQYCTTKYSHPLVAAGKRSGALQSHLFPICSSNWNYAYKEQLFALFP